MKRIVCILFLISVFMLECNAESYKFPVNITKILDGDTVKAQIDDNEFSIRLLGIDCYETSKIHRAYKQAYENNMTIEDVVEKGNRAKDELVNQLDKQKIYMEFKGIDIYGRVLGILYKDDFNINNFMENTNYCINYQYKKR